MSENFKKFKGGPTPVSKSGRPFDEKTTGPPMAHQGNKQFPKLEKRPVRSGDKHKHSPPVVPHHTTNPDWVYGGTHPLRIEPTLGPLVRPWAPVDHPKMMRGQGGQNTPEGNRYAKGGESVRPNPTNTARTTHGTEGIPMHMKMTKNVRGMIGKGKSKKHRSAY